MAWLRKVVNALLEELDEEGPGGFLWIGGFIVAGSVTVAAGLWWLIDRIL